MLEKRPVVPIAIGYILGIIMGLYYKLSIVLLYLIFFLSYIIIFKIYPYCAIKIKQYKINFTLKNDLIKNNKKIYKKFNLFSIKRYFRYFKIIFSKKVILFILLSSIISNSVTLYKNSEYEKIRENLNKKDLKLSVIVLSNPKEYEYKNQYKVKVEEVYQENEKTRFLNKKKVYIDVNKNIELKYGDKITIYGKFLRPDIQRNYGGFDYSNYLKTQGIYGTIKIEKVYDKSEIDSLIENKNNINNRIIDFNIEIKKKLNTIFLQVKSVLEESFREDVSSFLTGIILGDTSKIEEETKTKFSDLNVSHILAVSGMHIGYIIMFCSVFRFTIGKRKNYYLTIIVLIIYSLIIGFHASAIRAVIMAILLLFSKLIYRKSDVWTNIFLSLLSLLIYNPFLIQSIGVIFSYLGTIGVIIFLKSFKIKNKVLNLFYITIFVNLFILPFLCLYYNKIPVLSLAISPVIGILISPIFILGCIFIFVTKIKEINFLNLGFISLLQEFIRNSINRIGKYII